MFFLSLCVWSCLRLPSFLLFFIITKNKHLEEICWWDQKKIFCSGETLHVLVDIVRSVSFSIFNEKKKWEKSIGFFFCSKQTDVVSLSVLSQLKGVLYAKFWNLEDTCLCVCVFVTNLVLFRWVETSNNRICWSCIFIFQASYCLMKVNFPVLCGYLFSRFLYKNKK